MQCSWFSAMYLILLPQYCAGLQRSTVLEISPKQLQCRIFQNVAKVQCIAMQPSSGQRLHWSVTQFTQWPTDCSDVKFNYIAILLSPRCCSLKQHAASSVNCNKTHQSTEMQFDLVYSALELQCVQQQSYCNRWKQVSECIPL